LLKVVTKAVRELPPLNKVKWYSSNLQVSKLTITLWGRIEKIKTANFIQFSKKTLASRLFLAASF